MSSERRLRILYLADGRSVHTKRWVGWFARRHDVLLVSIPGLRDEPWDQPDIPLASDVPSYRWPLLSSAGIVLYLRRLIRRFRPDFVHAHYLVPNAWLATATGFPRVVTTAWGSDLLLAKGLSARANAWALRRACLSTADSQEAVDRLIHIGGESARVELVQFGVDVARFTPGAPSGELRRQWRVPASARLLVSPRLLRSHYNGETIANAFIALAPRYPDIHLIFLTHNADPTYQQRIEASLDAASLRDRVRFAASISHGLMAELYREAAVILSVPSSDTTPVTLLEGMACGSVVISSDLPSVREWVSDGTQGFLVQPGNAAALAVAVENALGLSAEQRVSMAAVGRHVVLERASQDAELTRMEHLLFAILNDSRERSGSGNIR